MAGRVVCERCYFCHCYTIINQNGFDVRRDGVIRDSIS